MEKQIWKLIAWRSENEHVLEPTQASPKQASVCSSLSLITRQGMTYKEALEEAKQFAANQGYAHYYALIEETLDEHSIFPTP
jgi:hypothetical protein